MHNSGFLMLDLKPNNIVVGDYDDKNLHEIRLIDFGISKTYKKNDGTHVKKKSEDVFLGNFVYASVNAMLYET